MGSLSILLLVLVIVCPRAHAASGILIVETPVLGIVRGDMAEGEARLKTGAPPMMNLFSHRRNRKGLLILPYDILFIGGIHFKNIEKLTQMIFAANFN